MNNLTLKNTHHGHAIKRIRHSLGMKQDTLATILGISQTQVSIYEQKKNINGNMIDKFANALNIDPKIITELEEDTIEVLANKGTTDKDHDSHYQYFNDNPFARIIELSNEKSEYQKLLFEMELKKISLSNHLLELEKEINSLLKKILKDRK